MTPRYFETPPSRPVQAWQILVGLARNRRTIRYEDLGFLMYGDKHARRHFGPILLRLHRWCVERKLPPINVLVVLKRGGTPSHGYPKTAAGVDRLRERVYSTEWWTIIPPTEAELD